MTVSKAAARGILIAATNHGVYSLVRQRMAVVGTKGDMKQICRHFRFWHFCDMAKDANEGRG